MNLYIYCGDLSLSASLHALVCYARYTENKNDPYSQQQLHRGGANSGNHYNHTSLVNIEGLKTRDDVDWYLGKKIAYIFKAKTKKKNSNFRVIWGKVVAPHGSKGVVRAKSKSA